MLCVGHAGSVGNAFDMFVRYSEGMPDRAAATMRFFMYFICSSRKISGFDLRLGSDSFLSHFYSSLIIILRYIF